MSPHVKVGLLGPLEVWAGDRRVTVAAGQQRVVLATLALHAGHVLRPAELIDSLWGEDPPATAQKSLQTYVARLRRLLPAGWIASTAGGYVLALPPEDVDAWRFERAVIEGGRSLRRLEYDVAARLLRGAVGLWRGDPVDLGRSARGTAAAARLHELWLSAEEELGRAWLALGGGEELVAGLEAAVRQQPLRERRWEQLMVALYRSGRQADALRAYQRVREVLLDELGIEPGPELQAVHRSVLDQSPTLLGDRGGRPVEPTTPQPRLPATVDVVDRQPIAGRGPELALMAEEWRRAAAGECRAVLVHGAAGMGKTRLAAAVAGKAHDDGALVLFGSCERDPLTPYQPIVEALRPLLRAAPEPLLTAGPSWEAVELARLLPELGDRLGVDPPAFADQAGTRHRLFESVAALLRRQARTRPTLLLLDDMHWMDRASTALLRHLLRSQPASFLLLGAHRSGDPESDAQLAEWTALVPPEAGPDLVSVGPLDVDAVGELTGDRRTAVAVRDASGGSPLFVSELLRFRADTGRLPGPDELPAGLRQALLRRIGGLRPSARRVSQAAALFGDRAAITQIAQALDLPPAAVHDAVDDAVAGHVLRGIDDAPGLVGFTHGLVRTALLAETSASRRAHLHRRIAGVLMSAAGDGRGARSAQVVHHLAAASGGERDPEVAHWAVRAADFARAKLAWEDAASHLELALRHTPDDAVLDRVHTLVRLGEVSRAAGREKAAKRHYLEAIDVGRASGLHEDVARAVLAWTEIPVDVRQELHEAIVIMRDALDGLPSADAPLRAQLMGRLAFSLAWARDPDSRTVADAAVAMARRTRDPLALARTLFFASSSRDQFEAFDPNGAAGELRALAPALHEPQLVAWARYATMVGYLQRGDREAADEALHQLESVAEEHHLIEADFRARVARGHLALVDGHLAIADIAAEELLELAGRSEAANLFLFAGALQYDVRREQGRLPELLWWFDEIDRSGQDFARVRAMRAEVLLAAGRHDEAAAALAGMVERLDEVIAPAERPHSIVTLATVASRLGDTDAARLLRAELAPWSGLLVYDGVNGPLRPVDEYLAALDAASAGTQVQ